MGIPVSRELPGNHGITATEKGSGGSFAKTCFDGSVAEWSPKTQHLLGFLIAYLAFSESDSCSVNPQVVGSSPTRGAKKSRYPFAHAT